LDQFFRKNAHDALLSTKKPIMGDPLLDSDEEVNALAALKKIIEIQYFMVNHMTSTNSLSRGGL
jgi:hypothetical protein